MNCEKWLEELLRSGKPFETNYVKEKARRNGFTRGELRRARKDLGVRTCHQRGPDEAWFWYMEV